MKLILECLNEHEWSQLFSTAGFWGRIPLHLSCDRDDKESVELMLGNLGLISRDYFLRPPTCREINHSHKRQCI